MCNKSATYICFAKLYAAKIYDTIYIWFRQYLSGKVGHCADNYIIELHQTHIYLLNIYIMYLATHKQCEWHCTFECIPLYTYIYLKAKYKFIFVSHITLAWLERIYLLVFYYLCIYLSHSKKNITPNWIELGGGIHQAWCAKLKRKTLKKRKIYILPIHCFVFACKISSKYLVYLGFA